jgi:hypothetical protein
MRHGIDRLPNAPLTADGSILSRFRAQGIRDYATRARHVWRLPYGRIADRSRLGLVLDEGHGTCTTKHALLAELAREHGVDVRLTLGICAMHERNTPGVGAILARYGLAAIPEAHCYSNPCSNVPQGAQLRHATPRRPAGCRRPFPAFRAAGLFATGSKGSITDWTAIPWISGGSAAIVRKDPTDAATLAAVSGIAGHGGQRPGEWNRPGSRRRPVCTRVVDSSRPRFSSGSSPGGRLVRTSPVPPSRRGSRGKHTSTCRTRPTSRASFFLVGPGVSAGRPLGIIPMRDIAPILVHELRVALPSAERRMPLP